MTQPSLLPDSADDYAFSFDLPIESVIFGGEVDLSGWLLQLEGKPVNGIRAVARRKLLGRRIFRARRKRSRPDVAASYPELPNARTSGFFIKLRLPLGRSRLTLQVQDHDRVWRTFYSTSVVAFPLAFCEWLGLSHLRRFLISYLKHLFTPKEVTARYSSPVSIASTRTRRTSPIPFKHVDLFATSKSNLFILEIGELVAAGFREIGRTARVRLDEKPASQTADDTLQMVVTPHEYYNLYLREILPRRAIRELTRNLVLFCTEQPETGWFQSNLQWATHARGVADINALSAAAYQARGLPCYHFQLGYHPALAHPAKIPHRNRTYDVTFLGSMTPRREKFIAEHANFFSRHRCHLRLVPLGFAKTSATRSYLTVERRNELLSNSRILLNLHYSEQKYFEWHRMLVGLANGCCIITETCHGYGALQPGRHFIMVEPEYLVPCCEYYLAHPEECARIARQGLEFIETHLRQSQGCETFLQQIEANDGAQPAAAGVPSFATLLDSSSTPLPSDLMRNISRHTAHLLGRALFRDLREFPTKAAALFKAAPTKSVNGTGPGEAVTKSLEQEMRLNVLAKRQGYKARFAQQEAARDTENPLWERHENEAFKDTKAPLLSVLITLYNYAHYIDGCLASIARAAAELRGSLEVVIVNDASTDNSLSAAIRCQQKSQLPILIVDKRLNTGLADARNVGLANCRSPYVFMMDADNLVFAKGLKQLLDVISGPVNYAAVYSLLCRFRGNPADREGLLSYFDWDPQILVQHPYIDAMAMFRRDTLLELGGYDNELNQIGWFGWEDYDLWLRFALHDQAVGFVPNTLCLYRQHETSMINTTNLFEKELVDHFMRNYGELLDRFEPRATVFGVDRHKIAGLARAVPAAETAWK
jgi:glycosyltransferase involved in cell wall biosynthesis